MRYQCRTIQEMIARLAWQAMCGVQMPALGKGLAGLMVDPTNQNVGNVIFWLPQVVLAAARLRRIRRQGIPEKHK
jgi:hypothetical protein